MAVIPMLSYEDGASAIDWLVEAFGFEERLRFTDDDGMITHAELVLGATRSCLRRQPPTTSARDACVSSPPRLGRWPRCRS